MEQRAIVVGKEDTKPIESLKDEKENKRDEKESLGNIHKKRRGEDQ